MSPDRLRFAIVTPSYYVDFERCRWLCETVQRHVQADVVHHVVVDRADRDLFAPLASSRTRISIKEDVLGGRFRQVPFARRWWIGPRGLPVRGWIVQQLTKLFIHEVADEDVFLFVDSGAFFVRPFDPRAAVDGDLVPLFRESGDFFRRPSVRRWHRVTCRLLGLRPERDYDVNYVKTLVTWRRDNLRRMHEHVARVAGRPSMEVLARQVTLSEYFLYGTYCDLVLGDRAGHYHTGVVETLSHWSEKPLNLPELRRLRDELAPEHVLVMINEKSRTPLGAIRGAFGAAG